MACAHSGWSWRWSNSQPSVLTGVECPQGRLLPSASEIKRRHDHLPSESCTVTGSKGRKHGILSLLSNQWLPIPPPPPSFCMYCRTVCIFPGTLRTPGLFAFFIDVTINASCTCLLGSHGRLALGLLYSKELIFSVSDTELGKKKHNNLETPKS